MPGHALQVFYVSVWGLVGACIGSFLNVVIWRLPRGENLSHPGSHCPRCNQAIRWRDNLPIVSWLLLRARCRGCRAPISARYPGVEALTAALFVLAALRYGPTNWPHTGAVAALLAALVAITFIDIDHRIIPDAITKPGMVLALVLAMIPAVGLHPPEWIAGFKPGLSGLLRAGAGILAGLLVIYGVRLLGNLIFKKEAMGLGDAKLLGLVGGFTGPLGALYSLTLACIGGVFVHGGVVLVTRRRPKPCGMTLGEGARGAPRAAMRVRADAPAVQRGATPQAFRIDVEAGDDLPPSRAPFRAVLPKVRVLMDEDVTVSGVALRLPEAPPGRAVYRLEGLSPDDAEHLAFFAASHRYLPFGPYLALGGALAALYADQVHHLLTVAYPRFLGLR